MRELANKALEESPNQRTISVKRGKLDISGGGPAYKDYSKAKSTF